MQGSRVKYFKILHKILLTFWKLSACSSFSIKFYTFFEYQMIPPLINKLNVTPVQVQWLSVCLLSWDSLCACVSVDNVFYYTRTSLDLLIMGGLAAALTCWKSFNTGQPRYTLVPPIIGYKNLKNAYSILGCFGYSGLRVCR